MHCAHPVHTLRTARARGLIAFEDSHIHVGELRTGSYHGDGARWTGLEGKLREANAVTVSRLHPIDGNFLFCVPREIAYGLLGCEPYEGLICIILWDWPTDILPRAPPPVGIPMTLPWARLPEE